MEGDSCPLDADTFMGDELDNMSLEGREGRASLLLGKIGVRVHWRAPSGWVGEGHRGQLT